jgi:hypothetical protein
VLSSSARLLRGEDLIRFLPDAGFLGRATLSFRAWDQSSGVAGTTANTALVRRSAARSGRWTW